MGAVALATLMVIINEDDVSRWCCGWRRLYVISGNIVIFQQEVLSHLTAAVGGIVR